jgi:hypothetical protein
MGSFLRGVSRVCSVTRLAIVHWMLRLALGTLHALEVPIYLIAVCAWKGSWVL